MHTNNDTTKEYCVVQGIDYINSLLIKHNIEVVNYRDTATGISETNEVDGVLYSTGRIEIPVPADLNRFCVCLHEIYHAIDKNIGDTEYLVEYRAEQFAINEAKKLGYECKEYIEYAKYYVGAKIGKSLNDGGQIEEVPSEIIAFAEFPVELVNQYKGFQIGYYMRDGAQIFQFLTYIPRYKEAFYKGLNGQYTKFKKSEAMRIINSGLKALIN